MFWDGIGIKGEGLRLVDHAQGDDYARTSAGGIGRQIR